MRNKDNSMQAFIEHEVRKQVERIAGKKNLAGLNSVMLYRYPAQSGDPTKLPQHGGDFDTVVVTADEREDYEGWHETPGEALRAHSDSLLVDVAPVAPAEETPKPAKTRAKGE